MSLPAESQVGLRELRDHLREYVRRVQSGGSVTITDRGKPVGRLVPMVEGSAERLQAVAASDLVEWSGTPLGPRPTVARARGSRTVAGLLLDDRE